jgi:hypothetical protein
MNDARTTNHESRTTDEPIRLSPKTSAATILNLGFATLLPCSEGLELGATECIHFGTIYGNDPENGCGDYFAACMIALSDPNPMRLRHNKFWKDTT